jgi:DNA-binding MarR family transcriptional regulator
MGEASDDLVLADGVLTGVVDRLEEQGLVARSKDPVDRRAIQIGLTERGKALTRSAMKPYEVALQQIFSEMDLEAVERFTEGFERLAQGESLAREVAGR